MTKDNTKKQPKRPASKAFKIIVEKHADGYVAYPLGLKGVVVGEGDTYEEAHDRAVEAIEGYLESLQKDGLPFPDDIRLREEPVKEEIKITIPEPA